ncbi:hypothetical protein VZ95_17925 [Elstera litoralis]|uniref:Uncharacterized protein n=1 Tax=Elstera litoralis TaxID=552518 RepID=A0A0F3IS50_9PROT|nr:hypothetical protein [Elstera litoralis]KJV08419.1 hypothetical protein VZ95_17925 [Elstera litoralis]
MIVVFGYFLLSIPVNIIARYAPWLSFALYGIATLVTTAAFSAFWAQLWTARIAAEIIGTLSVSGEINDLSIHQSTLPSPGRGEGLLGAVDFTG